MDAMVDVLVGAETFTPAYIQNVNEQFFNNIFALGFTAVSLMKGGRMINYVYNQTKKLWQTEEEAGEPTSGSSNGTQRSTRRALGFEEITLIP